MSQLLKVLFFGNPLWDCLGKVGPDFLKKYKLDANSAILDDNAEILSELKTVDPEMTYLAGGSAQNSVRACVWTLQNLLRSEIPAETCAFTGCVAADQNGKQMEMTCQAAGVQTHYQVCKEAGIPTGTCAVLINEKNRSLVANLAAAEKFQDADLSDDYLARYDIFYFEGFFTGASEETIRRVAKYARDHGKKFAINVSADFVPFVYKALFVDIFDSIDYLFANEQEIAAFAEHVFADIEYNSLSELALKLVTHGTRPAANPLTVVVTQGADETIIAKTGDAQAQLFPIEKIKAKQIVDTNGAGDSYVGGFIAGILLNRPYTDCARLAAVTAKHVIQKVGATYEVPAADERAQFASIGAAIPAFTAAVDTTVAGLGDAEKALITDAQKKDFSDFLIELSWIPLADLKRAIAVAKASSATPEAKATLIRGAIDALNKFLTEIKAGDVTPVAETFKTLNVPLVTGFADHLAAEIDAILGELDANVTIKKDKFDLVDALKTAVNQTMKIAPEHKKLTAVAAKLDAKRKSLLKAKKVATWVFVAVAALGALGAGVYLSKRT